MNPLIIANVWASHELAQVKALDLRFSPNFRVVTPLNLDFGTVWRVPDSNKYLVNWTKRFLVRFLQESFDSLVKIDPDTVLSTLPAMPENCDVAGDFRKSPVGWVWLGACQYYTRAAVMMLLADPVYTGGCYFQDVALASSVARLNLRAYNMPEIDGWSLPDSTAAVKHPSHGSTVLSKRAPGLVDFQL
jgi:hypothetical protein